MRLGGRKDSVAALSSFTAAILSGSQPGQTELYLPYALANKQRRRGARAAKGRLYGSPTHLTLLREEMCRALAPLQASRALERRMLQPLPRQPEYVFTDVVANRCQRRGPTSG